MRTPRPAALFLAILAGCMPALPIATTAPWTSWIAPSTAITVAVDRLDIHVDPSAAADSVGSLARGDVALVQAFPVVAEGAVWYYVQKVSTPEQGRLPDLPAPAFVEDYALVGWVAANSAAGEHLARTALRCPTTADFDHVSGMLAAERLACFGSAPLTVEGTFGCEECSGGELGTHAPSWLAGHGGGALGDRSDPERRPIWLYFPPAVAAPAHDSDVRITGHFDDPTARTCVMDPIVWLGDDAATLLPPDAFAELVVQTCRQRFVVDSLEVLSSPSPVPVG